MLGWNAAPPPLLVIISGPSGVGKTSALDALKKLDRPWSFVVTATTRPMREGERDGIDYIFLDDARFQRLRRRNELLECAQVYGRWYGSPRGQARKALQAGRDVFLQIDVQGAAAVREIAPEAVSIFIAPGSYDDLRLRLESRGAEGAEELALRLRTAREELARAGEFDYRVVNRHGGLDQTVADIEAILTAEKCRVRPRRTPQI